MVITEFFFAVAVTTGVFISVAAVSVLGPVGIIVVPLPVLYFYSRLGRFRGTLLYALVLLIVAGLLEFLDSPLSIGYFLVSGSLGLILSEVLRRNLSIEKTIAAATAALLIVAILAVSLYGISSGTKPWLMVKDHVAQTVRENIEFYEKTGAPEGQLELIRSSEQQIAAFLFDLMPSLAVTGTALVVWLNVLAGAVLFRRRSMWYPAFSDLNRWKLPDRIIWVVALMLVCTFLPWYGFLVIGLNGLVVLLFLYMLQGFAIVSFFFDKKNVPLFLRVAGYGVVLIQQMLLLLVALVGLIDLWADFRRLGRAEPQKGSQD